MLARLGVADLRMARHYLIFSGNFLLQDSVRKLWSQRNFLLTFVLE
jgi:hypothetical protein